MGVISELNQEYQRNPSLKHKFFWVDQPEYIKNRQRCFKLKEELKSDINNTFYFLRETARDNRYGVSKVDLVALSYCEVLSIPVITDDYDMLLLAKEYEIKTYTSLELLKLMYDCGFISIEKVRTIAEYWVYIKDTPKAYKKSYTRLFKEPAPK
ncbi:MAG: hypothetical protein GY707_14225 [Desulfobacteraceae bacterium]|nr:hypothetical protein [Desulfobacteraceae bacterium]